MTNLAMSWDEWARHDGVGLADRVRAGEISPAELAAQAAAGIAKVDSELSGNVIDLCPVGALTSKPFRFKARAWSRYTS